MSEIKKYYTTQSTDIMVYEVNPSIDSLQLSVKSNKVFSKGNDALIITNMQTGESTVGQAGATFVREELVDTEKFIKIYTSGIEHLAELTASAFKVFQLIYREMIGQKDIDRIFLDFHELKHFGKWRWSNVTFKSGINELLQKEIIYKSIGTNQYFINVNLFFNGDRVNVVKSYKLKSDAQKEPTQPSLLEE